MNDNYEKRVLINTTNLAWDKTLINGVFRKLLSKKDDEETSIIKIEKNNQLNIESKINSVEIFILEGTYINEFGEFDTGTYLRLPKEDEAFVKSIDGCTIFRKINYFNDDETVIIDTNLTYWLLGHGNLEVKPLSTQTALVKWLKDERFVPHRHWGGEEILVLSGTFKDEHGTYPQGSWIRSPHMSEHFPFVEKETIIFVKTGHL